MPLLLIATATLACLGWLLGVPLLRRWRRHRIAARPFPSTWRAILHRRVPYYRKLPVDLQLQLKRLVRVFLAEKTFVGCAGLRVTEEMRVVIAAQACLLLLNRHRGSWSGFPELRQILVYPGAFAVERLHPMGGGVLQEQRRALTGESWSQGQVVLSWEDTLRGASQPDGGHNVVVHEFAHQLDQETGAANGAPRLVGGRKAYKAWSRTLATEYNRLRRESAAGEPTLLDPYGATDPAEFFAVSSEVFFGQPQAMAQQHPALYQQLRSFYRVDPLSW